ncbi:MAG: DUF2891 domain-containing protein [Planctomycetota bacterium]
MLGSLMMLALLGSHSSEFDLGSAKRFVDLALECVGQEYPNKIGHVMRSDADALAPRQLTPAFYGCFDWHSAVHGHWLLARLCRTFPDAEFTGRAREALGRSLTPENIEQEVAYFAGEGRGSFERPYGLAWLLQLAAELHEWDDPAAREWSAALAPLEQEAANRFSIWLPKLSHPIRTGEHSQTAFAMGLVLDWARTTGDTAMEELIVERSRSYYLEDRACNLAYEPGGEEFLSPCLAEADLMRRVLDRVEFAAWLGRFLPDFSLDGSATLLEVAVVTDRSDGKLAHLDGLNLSRAWMLEGIASGLPEGDPRLGGLLVMAGKMRTAGIASVTGEYYEGGHWLGSFAVYLVSSRGLRR